jgi:hypothetical protein
MLSYVRDEMKNPGECESATIYGSKGSEDPLSRRYAFLTMGWALRSVCPGSILYFVRALRLKFFGMDQRVHEVHKKENGKYEGEYHCSIP